MREDLTEMVFILDKSGSMGGLESDTIGGFNAMLERQKSEPGEAVITTVLFDDEYELLHDRINIRGVMPICQKDYCVGGSTALLDAIGKIINKIGDAQKHTSMDERAGRVIFVITTDGMENASREYSCGLIRAMVERQKSKYGWEFIFLGANIDAIATAAQFGICGNRAANYRADGRGTKLNYEAVCGAVSDVRAGKQISKDWKLDMDNDYLYRDKE